MKGCSSHDATLEEKRVWKDWSIQCDLTEGGTTLRHAEGRTADAQRSSTLWRAQDEDLACRYAHCSLRHNCQMWQRTVVVPSPDSGESTLYFVRQFVTSAGCQKWTRPNIPLPFKQTRPFNSGRRPTLPDIWPPLHRCHGLWEPCSGQRVAWIEPGGCESPASPLCALHFARNAQPSTLRATLPAPSCSSPRTSTAGRADCPAS